MGRAMAVEGPEDNDDDGDDGSRPFSFMLKDLTMATWRRASRDHWISALDPSTARTETANEWRVVDWL